MGWVRKVKPHACKFPHIPRNVGPGSLWACNECGHRYEVVRSLGPGRDLLWRKRPCDRPCCAPSSPAASGPSGGSDSWPAPPPAPRRQPPNPAIETKGA